MIGQTAAPVPADTLLFLDTRPVPLSINSLVYHLELSAFTATDQFGSPPEMDTALYRLSTTAGRVTGEQEHVYAFSSTDMQMTASRGLSSLRLDTKAAFAPTKVDTTFTPVTSSSVGCALFTGGHGVFTQATGTLSSKTFRIHTGTSPFFGTITTAPLSAIAVADPGCSFGGGVISGSASGGVPYFPCSGRETIQAGSPFGITTWSAEVGFGGRHAYLLTQTGTSSTITSTAHLAIGLENGSDMPLPRRSASGASATLETAGNPLFGGQAIFTSHHAPTVSAGHTCSYEGHLHRFVATRYSGSMAPVTARPLAALFDTGTFAYRSRAATLIVRHYVS